MDEGNIHNVKTMPKDEKCQIKLSSVIHSVSSVNAVNFFTNFQKIHVAKFFLLAIVIKW